jgi:hypothetical protein
MTEWMLEDVLRATPLRHMVLRYFNVVGSDPKGRTGQSTPKPTHLIKRGAQAAVDRVPHLFGMLAQTPQAIILAAPCLSAMTDPIAVLALRRKRDEISGVIAEYENKIKAAQHNLKPRGGVPETV